MSTNSYESQTVTAHNSADDEEYVRQTLAYMDSQFDNNSSLPLLLNKENMESEKTLETLPSDFDYYNMDDLEGQIAESTALEPLRESVAPRLGMKWVKGAGMTANLLTMRSSLSARREWRENAKMLSLNPAERLVYIEKKETRRNRMLKLGAAALGIMTFSTAIKYGIDHTSFFALGGGTSTKEAFLTNYSGSDKRHIYAAGNNSQNYALVDNEKKLETTGLDRAILKQYVNTDSSFYDYSHKDFRGDFGPALQASPLDGKMPAGFHDAMSRIKHEPNGLGNLVSGLKLDGHDGSLQDRNNLADLYDRDAAQHAKADILIQKTLTDPSKFDIKLIDINFRYDTTYMVDNNGDPIIATQQSVNHGGTAYAMTNKITGETTYWRRECGFFQQIWPRKERVQTVSYNAPRTTLHAPQAELPHTSKPVSQPVHYEDVPQDKPVEKPTETPPKNTPPPKDTPTDTPYVKGPGYADEYVKPADSGDSKTPDVVVQEVTRPARKDIGVQRDPITDRFSDTGADDRVSGVDSERRAAHLPTRGNTSAGAANETANGSLTQEP